MKDTSIFWMAQGEDFTGYIYFRILYIAVDTKYKYILVECFMNQESSLKHNIAGLWYTGLCPGFCFTFSYLIVNIMYMSMSMYLIKRYVKYDHPYFRI